MPEASLSAERARELAQEILARPEYAAHRRDPTVLQRWLDDLAAWLDEKADVVSGWIPDWLVASWDGFWSGLRDLLGAVFGEDATVVVLRLAIAALLLGGLGILVHRVLRELRTRVAEEEGGDAGPAVRGPRLIDEADRFAREGRFLEAAHCTQLASLQLLLDKRCLELERSDPNRTLRRRLQEAPVPDALRGRFLELLDRLEGEWFRDRHDDQGLYGDWRALHGRIQSLPGNKGARGAG